VKLTLLLSVVFLVASLRSWFEVAAIASEPGEPVRLIFDTDMGNDIDDALALGVIHALQSRGECKLLAVTSSKDNEFSAPFIDLVNTFYGRGDIPVGAVRNGKTPESSPYIRVPSQATDDGRLRYPHKLLSGKDAPEAVDLLRKVLAAQPDRSVVVVVVGFSTNLARLLDSKGDDHSPMAGEQIVAAKCRLLSMMAGAYPVSDPHKEYNVVMDLPAAQKVFDHWPTPIVASGYEIGEAIKYPAVSIQRDFNYVKHHPLREAYELYQKMPYDRQTWDLTAALYAVRPDRGYFGLSAPGTIRADQKGYTKFDPAPDGRHRYLTVTKEQITRVREALVMLASQPPMAAAQSQGR
jgi:inosine-uridine nucleoside N-ribohydrolase